MLVKHKKFGVHSQFEAKGMVNINKAPFNELFFTALD